MAEVEHNFEEVKKNAGAFKLPANFKDYGEAGKGFKWEDHLKEVEWFGAPDLKNGSINAAYNAVDRHAKGWRANKIALYYEAADGRVEKYSYAELSALSNKFANVLHKLGIRKGDRVFIFLPRVPQVYVCFLGALKLGAIASTLFSAFGPEALRDRLANSEAKMLVTTLDLKKRVDEVRAELPALSCVMTIDKPKPVAQEGSYEDSEGQVSYEDEMASASSEFSIAKTGVNDPSFLLYTSGSTGKPKGVVHRHGGIVQQHLTSKWVLDLHDEDVYWCTADHGWVTGIAYNLLGPLSVGATCVFYDGRFDAETWYKIIEKYRVTVWYTAPTAIRMLMKSGDELARERDLSSLRHIYSVGEPLNPEAIRWGMKAFGLPFHDTWWQTEGGAMLITNFPSVPVRLGSMGLPFPGVQAGIVDDEGNELQPYKEGNLVLRPGWPAMMTSIWGDQARFDAYFKNGWYLTGDKAMRDKDGYYWFIGRADDVIKTAGERVGPFEVESALVEHPAVAEAGVIGKPDALRGEIIKAFIVLRAGFKASDELKEEISKFVKTRLSAHEYPREIEFTEKLPKTRSGKIMRRVLRAKEMGLPTGDLSTLED
ncbi:acetate--CoA ligase [Candidatus Micrarchaeota archaeon CG_4_10_14_0_2_um_filter_60_11]|nr:MAG: acetate--CoA ligase [Candidatus Micrarchaeota archaeon CG1_02_60_51]PIN95760.1 MAG: acetate--CoA ligase [Candidatus Micrarchaeota archaeon CG10_big_fil_rev_8_21_14_0_10_60_32]PIO01705.1 MAG: acetate--CoA ligase [Candidatus Micrarchaeota archaeon CG09_land_8_20_14_0_10_60_16]PIZ91327.1 MAG: acetate--CoA ligase [Candidatus Micrarchaeota archaeon CG_4_10_14_0_2_um_filter_60_11]